MRQLLIVALLLLIPAGQAQPEPTVRIGLNQNAATVTIRSASAVPRPATQHAVGDVRAVLALDPARAGTLKKSDLQYRMTVELDGDVLLAVPLATRTRD